mmetsp:Transcript_34786/g.104843  ORF Transcript_34786/g.104843 Transcript_34786/m.104843 type:complete len:206 (+) Transcript_34786:899-1516(+)
MQRTVINVNVLGRQRLHRDVATFSVLALRRSEYFEIDTRPLGLRNDPGHIGRGHAEGRLPIDLDHHVTNHEPFGPIATALRALANLNPAVGGMNFDPQLSTFDPRQFDHLQGAATRGRRRDGHGGGRRCLSLRRAGPSRALPQPPVHHSLSWPNKHRFPQAAQGQIRATPQAEQARVLGGSSPAMDVRRATPQPTLLACLIYYVR